MDWADRIGCRIRLRDLHILLAVEQHGSMARAADSLAISQPVVSKVIADLERAVGVRLLDRDRHGAEPTIFGRALLNRSVAAFDELRQGVKDIEFLQKPMAGELRIGATEPMSAGLLPAIVDKLSQQYPRIFFHVVQVPTNLHHYRPLLERDVEILIGRVPPVTPSDEIKIDVLFDEPILVAAGRKSPWARRRKIDLADLVDEPWILPTRENLAGQLAAELFRARGLPFPAKGATGGLQMNDTLLATGRYLGFYSRSLLRLKAKRWKIVVLPIDLPPQNSAVGIITLKRRTISPLARLFVECAHDMTRSLALAQM
jgi:DNA-binding transcriptional LysR family regulator